MKDRDYKSLIIRNAEDIINRQGIKSLTVASLVRRCKISNRSFYESFASKEELMLEIRKLYQPDGLAIPDEKQLILERAEEGIARNGFNNITLEGIAKSAGLKRGSIYKHFSDKYELLECCIEYQFDKTRQIMNLIFEANGRDPENYIRKYVENYAFFLNNSYDSSIFTEAWSHMNYRPKIRKITLELQEHFRSHIGRCLKIGIEQGVFKKDLDAQAVTAYLSIMINGMAYQLADKNDSRERISKECVDFMLSAFFRIIKD
jgi:Transcriptional regulator